MLKCENPDTDTNEILADFNSSDGEQFEGFGLQVDFEHGQWFITHLPTGTQWSVHDANNGFVFDQVSDGVLDQWIAEQLEDLEDYENEGTC